MVLFIKLIDKYVGNIICMFLSIFVRNKKIGNIKKILVIQLWGIGETVLTLPSIAALKKRFPNAKIEVLVTSRNKDVYFGNQSISRINEIDLNPFSILWLLISRFRRYDIAIDMEEYLNISTILSFFSSKYSVGYSHMTRSRLYNLKVKYNDEQHAALTFLDLTKALNSQYNLDSLLHLNYSKKNANRVDKLLKEFKIKRNDFLICVAPGAAESAKSRMWPFDRYADLCDELIERYNAKIIFSGSFNEFGLINSIQEKMEHRNTSINFAGKLELTELFYLTKIVNLFIGNDSGPMHVAAAQGTKTLGLFGPNLPIRFGPFGKRNIGLYKGHNCEFSPCINVHKGQVPDCLYPKNSNDYQKCMKNIDVNDVLKEVEKLIK